MKGIRQPEVICVIHDRHNHAMHTWAGFTLYHKNTDRAARRSLRMKAITAPGKVSYIIMNREISSDHAIALSRK